MRGRIRTIKPEVGKNEELWDLGIETGLPVYQAFTLLWCYADREGRFEWRPRTLKTDILPYWDGDFSRVLDALATRGFIRRYTVDGRDYGVIPTFTRHQVINNRETPSELPDPFDADTAPLMNPDTSTRERRVIDACHTPLSPAQAEGKGTEGNGKGTEGSDASRAAPKSIRVPRRVKPGAHFVPDDWQPNAKHVEHAQQLGVRLETERVKFVSHEFREKRTDWDRAFTGWLTRASQYATSSGSRPVRPPPDDDPERLAAGRRGLALLYGKTVEEVSG